MEILGTAIRLIMLVQVLLPRPDLPLGLEWGIVEAEFVPPAEEMSLVFAVPVEISSSASEVDPGYTATFAEYRHPDATGPRLLTAGFFDPNGELVGIFARTRVYEVNAFYAVSELQDEYREPGMDVVYEPGQGWDGDLFRFVGERNSMTIHLLELEEGVGGEWQIDVLLAPAGLDRRLSDLFPEVND